jgi:hypothetical protein
MDVNQPPPATELDALRIQAAAVAAQQARLTDEETQLNQRRDALEQREQQIAEHLEDRQRRLLELREEIKQERSVLEQDRHAFEEKKATAQAETARAKTQADRERRRFTEARKRFKQRWLQSAAEKQTSLQQHEQQLHAEQEKLHKETEAFQRERTHFAEIRLRMNGEIELGRRQLKAGWEELGLAQQQWEEALNEEHRDREQRVRELEARAAAVAEGGRKLAAEKQHWEETRARLLKETEGLETRVRNQRYQLQEIQRQLPPPPPAAPPARLPAVAVVAPTGSIHELPQLPAVIQRVAGQLADQRWLLLEHWSRFLQIEQGWQQERAALLADAEAAERHLGERGRRLDVRERELEEHEAAWRGRQELLARSRAELEGWQTHLTLRETTWESERSEYLSAVEAREQTAAALVVQLEAVRRRRQARRSQEVEELRQARTQCDTVRQEYTFLLRGMQAKHGELAKEQRSLAARAVALEHYRLELLHGAANSPAAEKRLEKLRRRSAARVEAAERKVTAQRQTLLAEGRRLEERARRLQQREDALTALQEQLSQRQNEGEQEQIARGEAELPRERELRMLRTQHEHDARQLAVLRDEVERIAHLLLENSDAGMVHRAA